MFTCVRWTTLLVAILVLALPIRMQITNYYRGTNAATTCQTCLDQARADTSFRLYEFAECQTQTQFAVRSNPSFYSNLSKFDRASGTRVIFCVAFRQKVTDNNLLVSRRNDFTVQPGSDVAYQNAYLIVLFVFAAVIASVYLLIALCCGPKTQESDEVDEQYSRMGLTINVHEVGVNDPVQFFLISFLSDTIFDFPFAVDPRHVHAVFWL